MHNAFQFLIFAATRAIEEVEKRPNNSAGVPPKTNQGTRGGPSASQGIALEIAEIKNEQR